MSRSSSLGQATFPALHYGALVDLLVIGGSGLLGLRIAQQAQLAGHRVMATFHASAPPTVAPTGGSWTSGAAPTSRHLPWSPARHIINAAYRLSDWETTADGAAHVALAAVAAGARLVTCRATRFLRHRPQRRRDATPRSGDAIRRRQGGGGDGRQGIAPAADRPDLADHRRRRFAPGEAGARAGIRRRGRRPLLGRGTMPGSRRRPGLALLELAASPHAGVCHVAGTDAISRYELGLLIAARDGLDPAALPVGLRAATGSLGALDVRLDSTATQAQLNTRLRGAREFLALRQPD